MAYEMSERTERFSSVGERELRDTLGDARGVSAENAVVTQVQIVS